MSNDNSEKKAKLLQLIRNAVSQDKQLREKYNIGEKFRFIRDRLQALLARVEENLQLFETAAQQNKDLLLPDETLIFVHLFNAQGVILHTWHKMLNPSVFYEYSINRPIYAEKKFVETFIKSKTNPNQHAYLTIAIKKQDVMSLASDTEHATDLIGNPLIKVREGSLKFNRLIIFTHNGIDYEVSAEGNLLTKK